MDSSLLKEMAARCRSLAHNADQFIKKRLLYRLHNGVNRVYSDKVRRLPGQAVFLH